MKKNLLSILCFLLVFSLQGQEDPIEEIITIVSKIPVKSENVLSTVDTLDKAALKRTVPRDFLSILSNSFAIDTSSNGGPGQVASIFLRGTNSNQTLVKVNGIKINPSTAGGASIYNFDPSLIAKIEIGSGPFSSIHGSEAIGGIINISTFEDFEVNSLEVGLSMGPDSFKKESLNSHWRRKEKAININLVNLRTDGFPSLTTSGLDRGYKNQSFVGTFSRRNKNLEQLISIWSTKGTTEYLGFGEIPISQNYKNQASSFNLSYKPNEILWFQVNLNSSKDFITQNEVNILGAKDLTDTERDSLEIMIHKSNPDKFTLSMGYILEDEEVDYASYGTVFNKSLTTKSIFTSGKFLINEDSIIIKMRNSDHEIYGNKISWNLGYRKNLSNLLALVLSTGVAFRSPNSSELYGYGANLELKPESSKSYELSLIRKKIKGKAISLVFFSNQIKNLIDFNFSEYILKNIKQSKTKGIELRYKWDTSSLNGNMLLRYQHPKDDMGNQLIRRSKKSISVDLYKDFNTKSINFNILAFDRRQDFGGIELPGYVLLNFSFLKDISNALSFSLRLENISDKEYFTAAASNGYYRNQGRSIWINTNYNLWR